MSKKLIRNLLIVLTGLLLIIFLWDIYSYSVDEFLSEVEKSNFKKASKYIDFNYQRDELGLSDEDAKEQWILRMKKIKEDGIKIVSYTNINTIKREGYYKVQEVIVSVDYNDEIYEFTLRTSKHLFNNKIILQGIDYANGHSKDNEIEAMLRDRLFKLFFTHWAG